MRRFAARGHRVCFVQPLGIRNPRLRHAARLGAALASRDTGRRQPLPFQVVSPKILPPRGTPPLDRLNRAWLARQLRACVRDPGRTVLWLRYPTPEVVDLVASGDFGVVVYEQVDDHRNGPGITRRLGRRFEAAEHCLLTHTDLVFVSSEPLRDRLAARHHNVVLAPAAAVDDGLFEAGSTAVPSPRLAVYAGSMVDFRFDARLVAEVARRLPAWRFLLVGPADRLVRRRLAGLPNVHLADPRPAQEIPALLSSAAVCLMPYPLDAFTHTLFPVKLVEYLAAGRPVVSVPLQAARAFDDVVELADGPEAYAAAIEHSAEIDTTEHRAERMRRVRSFSWEQRIDGMERAVSSAVAVVDSPTT